MSLLFISDKENEKEYSIFLDQEDLTIQYIQEYTGLDALFLSVDFKPVVGKSHLLILQR